jgi:hypothetical protein
MTTHARIVWIFDFRIILLVRAYCLPFAFYRNLGLKNKTQNNE